MPLESFRGDLMDKKIYQLAEQIIQLNQKAYEIYLPVVEDVCRKYFNIYSSCVKFYIEAFMKMWEDGE